jgi:Fe-Mn family superoxide dismutase
MAPYTLPDLPYDYDALEPYYSARQVELHHDKHHATYVKGANDTLAKLEQQRKESEPDPLMMRALEKALAFNISGHFLHSAFWPEMTPGGGGDPEGELAAAISESFGSAAAMRRQLNDAVTGLQGSGGGALTWEPLAGRLVVEQIYDHQNNVTPANLPLLVIDGWEHAYYLQYQNEKGKWLDAFWNLVSWDAVSDRFREVSSLRIPALH